MKKKKQLKAEKRRRENTGDPNLDDKTVTVPKKVFVFKQKETEDVILSMKMSKKEKDEAFKNRLAEKRKMKKEKNAKWREMKAKPEEDFLSSVFVGSKDN